MNLCKGSNPEGKKKYPKKILAFLLALTLCVQPVALSYAEEGPDQEQTAADDGETGGLSPNFFGPAQSPIMPMEIEVGASTVADLEARMQEIADDSDPSGIITLNPGFSNTFDQTVTVNITQGTTIRLYSAVPLTLHRDSGGNRHFIFNITGSATLTLYMDNITLDGNDSGGGVWTRIDDIIISGGEISGNEAGQNGGGVYAGSGGEISGNEAGWDGGGVFAGYTAAINGGRISGNTAGSQGGGLFIELISNLTMAGGSFSHNLAEAGGYVLTDYSGFNPSWDNIPCTAPFTHVLNNYDISYDSILLDIDPTATRHFVAFSRNYGDYGEIVWYEITSPGDPLDKFPQSPSRPGYRFTGWNEAPDGSGSTVTKTTTFTTSQRVYAQWQTLIPSGGEGPIYIDYTRDDSDRDNSDPSAGGVLADRIFG